MNLTRRAFALATPALLLPRLARAAEPRVISWDDLIPPGVPYPEIIGEGFLDEINDIWNPVFDENATRFNTDLTGQEISLPGYVIPLEWESSGVTAFLLVPYVGACIHVPPPPPNQLVFVIPETPWPSEDLWEAVWVTGRLDAHLQSTDLAEIGYQIAAARVEIYDI